MKLMTGYRMFKMRDDGLYPVGLGERWGYHSNVQRAQCTHLVDERDASMHFNADLMPEKKCECGYYAFRDPNQVIDMMSLYLKTEVEPEGRVELSTKGWRAEYMRVTKIWWPECNDCGKPALHMRNITLPLMQFSNRYIRDENSLVGSCNKCNVPEGAEPVLNYLNRLKIQYDCEITEATWTSEHTREPSAYPDPSQIGKLIGQAMAKKQDALILAAMKSMYGSNPTGSANPSASGSPYPSGSPPGVMRNQQLANLTGSANLNARPRSNPSSRIPWDNLVSRTFKKIIERRKK
jgi:hypothetical protein